MNSLMITLLFLLGALFQTWLPTWVFFGSLEWPLLTGLLIYVALRARRPQVIYSIVLAGFLYDSFSSAPLGASIPFFALVGLGSHALHHRVFSDHWITYLILGVTAVFLKSVYFSLSLPLSGLRPFYLGTLLPRLIGGLLIGAITVPAVYLLLSGFKRKPSWTRRSF